MHKDRFIITFVLALGFLLACSQTASESLQVDCAKLPAGFTSGDLVGTWVASYSASDKDILIISEDGTYKQIYEAPDANLRYESDWQPWTLEFRSSGYARLHLVGMHIASETDELINREGGGVDPYFSLIDVCEGSEVTMPHEVILVVTGAGYETPRGIILRHMHFVGSEWNWTFSLLED
jgi:hypothetical protein